MNHKHDSIIWILYWMIFSNALDPFFIVRADVLSKSPLIALRTKSDYEIPKCVRKNPSQKLEYYLPSGEKSTTIYFCPKTSASFLLYPSKTDICKLEPTPRLRRATDEESEQTECRNEADIRTLYTYGYQVTYLKDFRQNENDEEIRDQWKNIYTFCFDHLQGRILYFHYQISSPNLLPNIWLADEREYLEKEFRFGHFHDEEIEQYIMKIIQRYADYDQHIFESEKHQAMIMTPYDMAFAVWRKPFMHLINYAIFSNMFITSQWAQIGISIRKLAIQGWGELHIKVGTIHHNIGNLHRIWWKLVISQDENNAIAIIVHDYPLMVQSPHNEFRCETSCEEFGFDKIVSPLLTRQIFCCHPNVITARIRGLKSYGLFNLKDVDRILKPLPVECNSELQSTEYYHT